MGDRELDRLEMVERASREIYEHLSRAGTKSYHRKLQATAKELWDEDAAALEAYKATRRD